MKMLIYGFLMGAVLFGPVSVSAEDRAANVNIGGTGGAVDSVSVQKIRNAVGRAISDNIVDTLYIYSPRVGASVPIEGGLSLCAEAGFNSSSDRFNDFVQRLRSINLPSGTFYNVELTPACESIGAPRSLSCGGIQGKQCFDAQQYCDFGVGQCKVAGAEGICKDKPEICTREFNPVCGCDGKTYDNSCTAAAAGISINHPGECMSPEPQACGGSAGILCPDGMKCVADPSDNCDPQMSGADCFGICKGENDLLPQDPEETIY